MACNNFVSAVLSQRPKVAVFDCDGTLWTNNSGEDFFYWSMEQGLVSEDVVRWAKPRYEEYRRGNVDETVMCGEMTAMYAGVPVAEIEELVAKFFAEVVQPNIFEEMLTLTLALKAQGCALWAVSSTNEWVIKYGIRQFGIPVENVLAAQVICKDGIASGDLVRVPSGEGKAIAIKHFVSDRVDAVFGNSIHDAAMLELASHPYAVNPTPDLEQVARDRRWTMYWPEKSQVAAR
jgi:HAD superfamily hydrolase (TIGR01490 family)